MSKAGEVVDHKGVKVIGYENLPSRLAASASQLYAKNLYAFLETLIDKEKQELAINWEDELVVATNLSRDGAVVHSAFVEKKEA